MSLLRVSSRATVDGWTLNSRAESEAFFDRNRPGGQFLFSWRELAIDGAGSRSMAAGSR